MKMTVCKSCGHTSPDNEKCYQFTVKDVDKIDLNRIVREQAEAGHLITLLADGKEPKGLLVHKDFLEKFHLEDHVDLLGGNLSPSWGVGYPAIQRRGRSYEILISSSGRIDLENASIMPITFSEGIVSKIKEQIAAARVFTRKIKVVVHAL